MGWGADIDSTLHDASLAGGSTKMSSPTKTGEWGLGGLKGMVLEMLKEKAAK